MGKPGENQLCNNNCRRAASAAGRSRRGARSRVVMTVMRLAMIVAVIVTMSMAMAVMMMAAGQAGVGVEWRLDLAHQRAGRDQSVAQDVIELDTQRAVDDIGRRMAVAEAPGQSRQIGRVGGANFEQPFIGGDDLGMAPVLEHEAVAVLQPHGLRQVDEHLIAMLKRDDAAAQMALVGIEHDEIEGNDRVVAGDGGGAQHGQNRK